MKTVVIVASSESYRTADFLAAAEVMRVRAVVASDGPPPVAGMAGQLAIDLTDPVAAAAGIAALDPQPDAVVAVDDQGVVVAAAAAALLGLSANTPASVDATRNKHMMRRLLEDAGVPQPRFRIAAGGEVALRAAELGYPVVVKPVGLSASRGVIRVDGPGRAGPTEHRIRAILELAGCDPTEPLLVEEYVPGVEVAVEGIVTGGRLEVLAFIDKPDPLIGPFFEETLFVTPSRLPAGTQEAAIGVARAAVRAIGLETGPVHAEVRIPPSGLPRLIEVAARPIGGLCGRAFSFGILGESVEVMILRSALGLGNPDTAPSRPASGVLMLPIPAVGVLTGVHGLDQVRALEGVDEVTITVPTGRRVEMLPEGDRYLGFVFAAGTDANDVEDTLRTAASLLEITIDGEAFTGAPR